MPATDTMRGSVTYAAYGYAAYGSLHLLDGVRCARELASSVHRAAGADAVQAIAR